MLAVVLLISLAGCGKSSRTASSASSSQPQAAQDDSLLPAATGPLTQAMDRFTMEGFAPDGTKRWEMEGMGANIHDQVVTVYRPIATGRDKTRTAHLNASMAFVNQENRRVRLEHDVRIHTSDGVWLEGPLMYWLPDREEFQTDEPVRLETDHMFVRGRGAVGYTNLKIATILRDVELVLNPTRNEPPGDIHHVTITCDGPLTFDYQRNVATFEDNVRVHDMQGDLYSSKLVAYLDKDSHTIAYAEATGNVRIVQEGHTASGGRAVYEPAKGKITLLDAPSLFIKMESNQRLPEPKHVGGGPRVDPGQPAMPFGRLLKKPTAPDAP